MVVCNCRTTVKQCNSQEACHCHKQLGYPRRRHLSEFVRTNISIDQMHRVSTATTDNNAVNTQKICITSLRSANFSVNWSRVQQSSGCHLWATSMQSSVWACDVIEWRSFKWHWVIRYIDRVD